MTPTNRIKNINFSYAVLHSTKLVPRYKLLQRIAQYLYQVRPIRRVTAVICHGEYKANQTKK